MWQWPRARRSHVTVFTGTRTPMYSSVHAHTCANKHSKLSMLVFHTRPLLRAEWNSWEDILSIWPTSTSEVKNGRPGFSSPQWEGILESQQRVLPGLPSPGHLARYSGVKRDPCSFQKHCQREAGACLWRTLPASEAEGTTCLCSLNSELDSGALS